VQIASKSAYHAIPIQNLDIPVALCSCSTGVGVALCWCSNAVIIVTVTVTIVTTTAAAVTTIVNSNIIVNGSSDGNNYDNDTCADTVCQPSSANNPMAGCSTS
jgi:hypothetical protein